LDNGFAHVVNWKFEPDHVKATYIADDLKGSRLSFAHFFKYTVRIDPSTGKTSTVTKRAISESEYASLRTSRN